MLALAFGRGEEDGRRGNLPNLDLARRMQRRWMMIANRKRRRCREISPFGSTWWVLSIRRCNWLPCSVAIGISSGTKKSQLERYTLNLPSRIFQSFFDCTLLGYSIFKFPRLATICSAVNGLLVYLHLESVHHCLTAATSSRNCCSSLFGSTAGFAILFAMVGGVESEVVKYECDRSSLVK
jgi:hypothetical protein